MSLLERIDEDLKTALKARDMLKATVLRGLKSDIKYKQIEMGAVPSDDDIIAVLNTACKRHRDSIEQFGAGNRPDLVEKESAELVIIAAYLPEQMPEDKVRALIAESIAATGADSPAKTGLVMKDLMPKIKGRADGKMVSRLVSEMIAGEKK